MQVHRNTSNGYVEGTEYVKLKSQSVAIGYVGT